MSMGVPLTKGEKKKKGRLAGRACRYRRVDGKEKACALSNTSRRRIRVTTCRLRRVLRRGLERIVGGLESSWTERLMLSVCVLSRGQTTLVHKFVSFYTWLCSADPDPLQ